jgi:plastocyanin
MKIILIIISMMYSFVFSGTLIGNIKYEGKLPNKKLLKMDSDPICGNAHNSDMFNESFIVDDKNNLQNVLVWIKDIDYTESSPIDKKIINQAGCIYQPHILGIMKGQTLLIKNSDATLHNVHSYSKNNLSFNLAMPKVVKETEVLFNKIESPFPIKCDVHPWMKTWIAVFNHPYYTVTDKNGNYVIENIPEGKYSIVAFQEKFKMKGIIEKEVEIKNDKASEVNFKFVRNKK